MLDLRLIREETDRVRRAIEARGTPCELERILGLDRDRRDLVFRTDEMKNRRNEASRRIGRMKKQGQDTAELQAEIRRLGEQIKANDERLRTVQEQLQSLLLTVPNLLHESVPVGPDDQANVEVSRWGKPRQFDFEPRPHWEIGEQLGIFDSGRAAKLSGSGFALFTALGARLERALINMMLDMHTREHGFVEVSPSCLATRTTMTTTGQLPKMEEDMYRIDGEDLFLVPTAEVQLVNLYRDEIVHPTDLPIRLTAYTPCFRREAGSYGKDVRGLIRVHQFDKVEMVEFATPESSYDELECLLGFAEQVVQRLGLHYRVVNLCTGEVAFQATKCYDIEVWAPGVGKYLEVSSVSNCEDFQARRARIRFRREEGAKPEFVHTLNGSGLALPRTVIALVETYQTADGAVEIPEALRPYIGCERIEKS
ncbi:seryl-tRNA synthetase [candidate division BRC1 bacterium SM23_51]|nr:MAG: seryl-tRNA synthetase [candidate division BRC1 bacterium SM23_51]